MQRSSSTTCLPRSSVAVHCTIFIAVPLPPAPWRREGALQEFNCPRRTSSVAVHYSKPAAYCPQPVSQWMAAAPLPTAPWQRVVALHELRCPLLIGSVAGHHKISAAPCIQAMWSCAACPLPKVNVAVHYTTSGAYSPQAVWRCIATLSLLNANRECGGALKGFHYQLPQSSVAVHCRPTLPITPR